MLNKIQPDRVPRGYGGVAVLWQKEIDHLIKVINDGNERIQCIEFSDSFSKPMLFISVYLPTRGCHDLDEFKENVDQLFEICQKYAITHDILIGGDINEDLTKDKPDKRTEYMLRFLNECHLDIHSANRSTYINPKGEDCSEIDYFLSSRNSQRQFSNKKVLDTLTTNTSDHYPIAISCFATIEKSPLHRENVRQPRVKWDKIDKNEYEQSVNQLMENERMKTKIEIAKSELQIDEIVQETSDILYQSAMNYVPQKKTRKNKGKLEIWNKTISIAYMNMKNANIQWYIAGKPRGNHPSISIRKEYKRKFKSTYRVELARKENSIKEKIMNSRTKDSKTFFMLINKQRKSFRGCINDLHVDNKVISDEENILKAFQTHFEQLASPSHDDNFNWENASDIEYEIELIIKLTQNVKVQKPSKEEVKKALSSMKKGKALDIFGLSVENFLYAGEDFLDFLVDLIGIIFENGLIPNVLKQGLLSPVYKNKGSIHDIRNYRGITVLPVLCKIIETIIKKRIMPKCDDAQCTLQRGFTKNSAPINAAFMLEESRREAIDLGKFLIIILLDAKSAFDVVVHKNLMRRLYHIGIQDQHWALINDLHCNAISKIKLNGNLSESFDIIQGVRQGGVLSADLYKVYVDPLLHQLQDSGLGMKIGHVPCCATACADDITLNCTSPEDAQILLNMAYNYSCNEHYKLQPQKSVVIEMGTKQNHQPIALTMEKTNLNNVEVSTHLGIKRSKTDKTTVENTVNENIKKARRTAYSLMSAGFHGTNGLDPTTSIHLMKTYIIPILIYGLEVIIPDKKNLEKLEIFQKKMLKQILSLPQNTPDPVPYIISGLIPIEGLIHIRALTFLYSIFMLPNTASEKQIAQRQLSIKNMESNTWFNVLKKIIWKYNLPDIYALLNTPYTKQEWKRLVYCNVQDYWRENILNITKYYKYLNYLNCEIYKPGKQHPLIYISSISLRDTNRIPIKLKLVSGTYILQSTRTKFKQEQTEGICLLCGDAEEDLKHFVLECSMLQSIRDAIFEDMNVEFRKITGRNMHQLTSQEIIQIILDCSILLNTDSYIKTHRRVKMKNLTVFETYCRRYIYNLHSARYRLLQSAKSKKQ